MENRKLVEDRAAVNDPEFSDDAATSTNATPDKDLTTAEATQPAEDSDSTPSTGAGQNSTSSGNSTQTSGSSPWSRPASPAPSPTPSSTPSPTPAPSPTQNTVVDDGSDVERPDGLFGTKVPISVALVMAFVLPAVGFLIGLIGSGKDSSSSTVNALITPQNAGGALNPGKTVRFTVLVPNPNDYGAQVTTIREGRSNTTGSGCAEGTVTSAAVEAPWGYIGPNGVRAYSVYATMAPSAAPSCANQTFILPITIDLESAAG